MSVDINAYENLMSDAIKHFWKSRFQAAESQRKRGVKDQGNRASVTAGKNLDGFTAMIRQLIVDNGINEVDVYTDGRRELTIPGFYRPTKNWDMLVMSKNRLLAAIELKSQVGPSFGNNFNNRIEEALGNATDLNTAFREGAFAESQKPFVGYFFVVEECRASMTPVRFYSSHFAVLPEFENTSYAARYEIFCRKLIQERLYDATALVLTRRSARDTGAYRSYSQLTSVRSFMSILAGRIAAMAMG